MNDQGSGSVSELRAAMLKKRMSDLAEDHEIANRQLSHSLDEVDRLRIGRRVADIEQEMQNIERELSSPTNATSFGGAMGSSATSARAQAESIAWANIINTPNQLVDRKVGPFFLTHFLGAGGSGLVYKARHVRLGRDTALKIFYPLDPGLSDYYQLFERGFRALGALQHPNITRIFDFGQVDIGHDNAFYLAMEYVHGLPLDEWSKTLGRDETAFTQRLDAAVVVAQALQAAHDTVYFDELGYQTRGVLHGDLKPANVLFSHSDGVKLTDFLLIDIQRVLDRTIAPVRDTGYVNLESDLARTRFRDPTRKPATQLLGTPGYMAPEQAEQGIVTVATDIFGLGMTYCRLFFPWVDEFAYHIIVATPGAIPRNLESVIFRMLAPAPENRQRDVAEVIDQLMNLRSSLGEDTRPLSKPRLAERLSRYLRKDPRAG